MDKNKLQDNSPKQAIIYCRVSTQDQADSGLGLEAQEQRCNAYAIANGWNVVDTFIDAGVSAKSIDRPELKKALASLTPGSVLIVLKLDRLTRSVADLQPLSEQLSRAGAEWVSVQEKFDTSTATGRLMLRMILELSQWEREVIGERTSSALQQKKRRKERLGTTPLGYTTLEKQVIAVDGEQATVARARELRQTGLSMRKIAAKLTDEGHKTKRGGRWQAETIAKILKTRYIEQISN
ncbi:MAG: recombinase [bacterium]|nr:MAG: recombinase [bacterium]